MRQKKFGNGVLQDEKEKEEKEEKEVSDENLEESKDNVDPNAPTKESVREIKRLERRIGQLKNKDLPMEIDTEAVVSDTKLYLYGVDNMSTRDINE